MSDFTNRFSSPSTVESYPYRKRLGGYLVEAGLLTPAQVDVVLNDQKFTGMRFGEILAARGWVKQQTIEYLMQKVVLPEQQSGDKQQPRNKGEQAHRVDSQNPPHSGRQGMNLDLGVQSDSVSDNQSDQRRPLTRRDMPIAKPLPSVNTVDGDVSWVG